MQGWVKAGVVGTFMCVVLQGWAVFRVEFPKEEPTSSPPSNLSGTQTKAGTVIMGHPSPWLLFAPSLAASGMLLASVLVAFRKPQKSHDTEKGQTVPKLKIQSAFYGIINGPSGTDRDVTNVLQNRSRDAMAVLVTNDLFGCDPAPHRPKRLQVTYSYGDSFASTVSRPEGEFLVLPEDQSLVREKAEELKKIHGELKECRDKMAALASVAAREWTYFTVQKTYIQHENLIPDLKGGELLVVLLTNDSASGIEIMAPVWKSEDVQLHHPLCPSLQIENTELGGWKEQSFTAPINKFLVVLPGRTFKCCVPLHTPRGDGLERRLQKGKTGRMIFPAKVDNDLRSLIVDL